MAHITPVFAAKEMASCLLLMLSAAVSSSVTTPAVAADSPARKDGADSACVDVEVDGYRGLSYDCLGQQLAGPARARPQGDIQASEQATRRAPNQMGLANKAAASNRMGSNFGRSALPQRPPAPIHTSPLPGPRP